MSELSARHEFATRTVRNEVAALAAARQTAVDISDATAVAQATARAMQELAHRRIADVVTRCLNAVFVEDAYTFVIVFEEKRGRTEAVLLFERNGMRVDPMTAAGGGVVDVAAFALRLAALMLTRPPLRRVLVLDEPFRHVSYEYRQRVRVLLKTLADEMGVQFIMVTHHMDLRIGTVVEIV